VITQRVAAQPLSALPTSPYQRASKGASTRATHNRPSLLFPLNAPPLLSARSDGTARFRLRVKGITPSPKLVVIPFVRYRSSPSGQSASTAWLLWWPSRSVVDDPPDTRDQTVSQRSAPAPSARTGRGGGRPVDGSWLSLVVRSASQRRRRPDCSCLISMRKARWFRGPALARRPDVI
jgi:hypothetical protein